MDKKTRNIIIALIAVVAVVIVIVMIVNSNKDDGESEIKREEFTIETANGDKINTSDKLKEAREELGYYISNIILQRKDAQTVFSIQIANRGSKDTAGKLVDIVFLGKNGEEEARMALYIRPIKAGQSIQTQATINNDFTNVYNFRLEDRKTNS